MACLAGAATVRAQYHTALAPTAVSGEAWCLWAGGSATLLVGLTSSRIRGQNGPLTGSPSLSWRPSPVGPAAGCAGACAIGCAFGDGRLSASPGPRGRSAGGCPPLAVARRRPQGAAARARSPRRRPPSSAGSHRLPARSRAAGSWRSGCVCSACPSPMGLGPRHRDRPVAGRCRRPRSPLVGPLFRQPPAWRRPRTGQPGPRRAAATGEGIPGVAGWTPDHTHRLCHVVWSVEKRTDTGTLLKTGSCGPCAAPAVSVGQGPGCIRGRCWALIKCRVAA